MDKETASPDVFSELLFESESFEDIEKENNILHSVINSLSEGVIVADETGRFLFFNPAAQKILGIGSQNVPVDEWTSLYGCYYPDKITPFPSDQLPLVRAIRNETVMDEILFIRNEKKPHGIYINISASPIHNSHGEIRGGVVIFRDITRRKLSPGK